jgi:hypothetical protein
MDQDQKFSVILPAEFQKSEDGEWRVYGLASTPKRDLQGEVIDLKGLDLAPIQKGKGIFNWDHKEGPENTIGAIDTYKKSEEGLYLGGYLFKEHDRAKAIYQIMSSLKKSDRGRVGMSVEGVIKKRSGDDGKVISKATITKCALTMNPVNTDTFADLVKSLSASEVEFDGDILQEDGSVLDESLEKAGEGSKGGKVVGHTSTGAPIYESAKKKPRLMASAGSKEQLHSMLNKYFYSQLTLHDRGDGTHEVHNSKGKISGLHVREHKGRWRAEHHEEDETKKSLFTAEEVIDLLQKALGVGDAQATTLPQNITGGDALAKEDLDRKPKTCDDCKDETGCKCPKEMKKGDASFYKSMLSDLMAQLTYLYPEATQSEIWETVKDRLQRKFPSLNVGS